MAEVPSPGGGSLLRKLPVAAVIVGFGAFFLLGVNDLVSFETLAEHESELVGWVERHGLLAVAVYILIYAGMVMVSVPGGAVMTIAGGCLFGTVAGTAYAVLGATAGAVGLFLAVKVALGGWVAARAGQAARRMEEGFRRNALSYMLVLRLLPLFPFWLVNLVPAILGVPLRIYFIGTLIGMIPGTFVFASIGSGVSSVFARGEVPELSVVFEYPILLPIVGLALLALLPAGYRYLQERPLRPANGGKKS